jgi:hypothetical protein
MVEGNNAKYTLGVPAIALVLTGVFLFARRRIQNLIPMQDNDVGAS